MRRSWTGTTLFLAFLVSAPLSAAAPQFSRGRGGAVAAAEENAAKAGIEILKRGGNAADAAVAVAFALAVTWPEAGNIGGGGFWISRDAKGKTLAVDFREVAPRTARRDLFTRPGPRRAAPLLDRRTFRVGRPGSVDGLWRAHRAAGRLPWKAVLAPAVRLARQGFVMTETVSRSIAIPKYRKRLAADPEPARDLSPQWRTARARHPLSPAGARPHPGGDPRPRRGRLLSRTDRSRDRDGSEEQSAASITRGDLAIYSAKIRRALSFPFGGAQIVHGCPPPRPAVPCWPRWLSSPRFVGLPEA